MAPILHLATRIIAGITVPNTAVINSSIELARANLPDHGYNHIMRAWLNGQAIINHFPEAEQSKIDTEAFGVAAILHDMGWAFNTPYVTTDKIFEVDGADASREYLHKEGGRKWDDHRVQTVWDAIALHTSPDIARYKQLEVAIVSIGTYTELVGIDIAKNIFGDRVTVTPAEFDAIATEFPRPGLGGYLNDTFIELCKLKPEKTYGNFVGDWGEKYVPGYTKVGHRNIDILESALPN